MRAPASHVALYGRAVAQGTLPAAQRALGARVRGWIRKRRRPVEQAIVRERLFGFWSLAALGTKHGISRERVRQLEANLLVDLLKWCGEHGVRIRGARGQ